MSTFCLPWSEYTISGYIESKTDILAKIEAMKVLEAAMMASMLDLLSSPGANISMYELDDGQVRIKTGFQTMKQLEDGLNGLRKIKNIYINQFTGRCSVAQDKRTFI